ncbi:MAG: efflux RND transporter periplasmic adaptor subunit [Candidatus Fimenecus sp.]
MAILVIVVAALVISILYANFKPDELPTYTLAEVQKGDIQSTFDTQGVVESGSTETYSAASGVKVISVNVAVGDRVSEGQQLATFDVSSLNGTLSDYQTAYSKAKASYEKSAASVSDAKQKLADVNAQISTLEREIAQLETEIAAAENTQTNLPAAPSYSEEELQALAQQLQAGGMTQAQIDEIVSALKAQAGQIDVETAIANSTAAKKAELTQKQAQLSSLETQKSVYEAQTDETVADLYKSVMEQKKKEYESYKALVDSLANGWTASADGIVTEVNITAGQAFTPSNEQSSGMDLSALMNMASGNSDVAATLTDIFSTTNNSNTAVGTGMVVEHYGDFYASFTVGKYDLQDLHVGQKAKITSLDKEYEGEVIYVSAVATAGSGLDISSITSSLTGSSSSSSSNSAPIKVKINNPDEKVVIGFDVDISIDTDKLENVITIPVEAVSTNDGENCVFVYNEKEKTVSKRVVTLGIGSDTAYEVLEGLQVGEQVVLNPKTALTDGDKIQVK